MAIHHELIFSLDGYGRAAFRDYAGRSKKDALEVRLFDLYLEHPDANATELTVKLYDSDNRNAFKRTHQRLLDKLGQFYRLIRSYEQTDIPDAMSELHVAMNLLHKHAWEGAATFFRKAEQSAALCRQYHLLEHIYAVQLPYLTELGHDYGEFMARREINLPRYTSWCQLSASFSQVSERQKMAALEGRALDRHIALHEALGMWRPTPEEALDPAFMDHFVSLIRRIAVSTKSYKLFESFAGRVYRGLKRRSAFIATDIPYQVGMLYKLAHAQYRNAKFDEALASITEAEALIQDRSVVPVTQVRKLIALRASIYNYTGRIEEAIALLEQVLSQRRPHETDRELLNIQLSLAAYYYNATKYKKAIQTLNTFPHDNTELARLMGVEWKFKKEMFELISFYDRGHYDEAENHIRRMRSYYARFFQEDQYARVEVYLNIVRRMIKNPGIVNTPEFRQQLKDASLQLPQGDEDIQAIAFYCWVTAKVFKRDYYEVLLNAIRWKRGEVGVREEVTVAGSKA